MGSKRSPNPEVLKMENINLKWLHQFEMFLAKTQGVNGRAIYLRSLRAVCNYALHTNVISSYPQLFRKFLDYPASGRNAMFRDYFLLMFYLIGINSKDLLLGLEKQIINGRFEYIREKTHKKYSIRIEPEAEELLKRYKGRNYLLRAMDGCKHYKSFAHEMNDHLKMIGEEVVEMVPDPEDLFGTPRLIKTVKPVIPGISTYFARHCWATFAYEAGVPLDVISQALGHSSGNRTTRGYNHFFCDGVGPISGVYIAHKHIPLQPGRKAVSYPEWGYCHIIDDGVGCFYWKLLGVGTAKVTKNANSFS